MAETGHRILILAGRLAARGSTVQTLALARGLAAESHSVRIVCSDGQLVPAGRREGLVFDERLALEWPIAAPIVWRCIERDLRSAIPDVIHAQHRRMLPLARWLGLRWRRPVVLNMHDYLAAGETLRCDGRWLSAVITVSESVRGELLAKTSLAPERVHVIHSGVEMSTLAEPRCVLDPRHVPVVGTAGPLEVARGLGYFLIAAQDVLREQPRAQFLIAGAGPEERQLRQQARDLQLTENVTFIPSFSDFSKSLDAMDIYVLPSLKQGLGTIMLEAMARALPVIATSSGGVHSVVSDGTTGVLVPPSDGKTLARSILALLRDPLRARALGENARDLVRRDFPVARMVSGTLDLYRRLIDEWKPAPRLPSRS